MPYHSLPCLCASFRAGVVLTMTKLHVYVFACSESSESNLVPYESLAQKSVHKMECWTSATQQPKGGQYRNHIFIAFMCFPNI